MSDTEPQLVAGRQAAGKIQFIGFPWVFFLLWKNSSKKKKQQQWILLHSDSKCNILRLNRQFVLLM